ncbi:hypothetical protein PVAND_003177 [Polypedilum vanderplanki]|uniref:Ima1 N-terminal domain-containing protein n=1 Tax=Polypedilum vanderplanki TaxID=319348 RepID=A0A9J6BT94_POLVA|nr:hypothetical protein PVAND_003177 [Polypedilum vanderplanki]
MQSYSPNLIIATTVFGSIILLGFINFLIILRKRFSIKVNCWFCNTNLRVPYNDWNSFKCPKCEQYNGFTEDGDYNKEISAQFSSKLNNISYCQRTNQDERMRLSASNGFCEFCSRNQEIKVIQLANFRPRCESTYDQEIEEFKQKLDDSYQLCQQCQRHLNKTLNRVKTKFIGSKISQLRAKDNKNTAKIISDDDGKFLSIIMMTSILILSIANFMRDRDMKIELLSYDCIFFHHVRAFFITFSDMLMSSFKDLELNEIFKDVIVDEIATSALTLNLFLILNDRKNIKIQYIISMLLWAVKMVTNEIYIHSSYVMFVNGIIATSLIISSLFMFKKSKKEKLDVLTNGSFHKIHTEIIDDSDNEEIEASDPSSSSFFDMHSNRSAIFSTASKVNSTYRSSFTAPTKLLNSTIRNTTTINDTLNKSFSITKEVMAADRNQIQNDISLLKLNDNHEIAPTSAFSISSTIRNFNTSQSSLNPFSIERASRRGVSPTPSVTSAFSVSSRNNLISPPRLHSPQVYTNEVASSWIAGGYWTSPQKKYLSSLQSQTKPMISRSSSQSSGLGTIEGSEKNSRENSISQEDALSIFSDATSNRRNFFEKPSSRILFPETQFFNQQPKVHNNLFNSTFGGGSSSGSFRNYRESNTFFK